MADEERPGAEQPSSSHRLVATRWNRLLPIVLAGAGALVVSAGVAGIVVAASQPVEASNEARARVDAAGSDSPSPKPLHITTPAPGAVGDENDAAEASTVAIETLVQASNEVLQRADAGTDGLTSVATGFVEGEVRALAIEREQLGYRQIGEAVITSVNVQSMNLEGQPPVTVLDVCIDASDIDVVDSNNRSIGDQLYRPDHPVLHRYGLVHVDGLWKASTHDIPADATCN